MNYFDFTLIGILSKSADELNYKININLTVVGFRYIGAYGNMESDFRIQREQLIRNLNLTYERWRTKFRNVWPVRDFV